MARSAVTRAAHCTLCRLARQAPRTLQEKTQERKTAAAFSPPAVTLPRRFANCITD